MEVMADDVTVAYADRKFVNLGGGQLPRTSVTARLKDMVTPSPQALRERSNLKR